MDKNRFLIVNADDFGQSTGVNRGIIRAHQNGIVTSASLMVRYPAAIEAASYANEHHDLSVGLHLDIGEWIYREFNWEPVYEVIAANDVEGLAREVDRQMNAFVQLMGRLPTHIDSHQHVHKEEPLRSIVQETAQSLDIPLRHYCPITYRGDFYGQSAEGYPCHEFISVRGLIDILDSLTSGVTELGCHPGEADGLDTMYRDERRIELETLCNRELRSVIERESIVLCSFHNYILS